MVVLEITSQGRDKWNESDAKFLDITKPLLDDLTEEELDILLRVYEKYLSK
jgi:DNA-binding MarR family transcriptional regulator